MHRSSTITVSVLVGLLCFAALAPAAPPGARRLGASAFGSGGGTTNLPQHLQTDDGTQWYIHQNGAFQHQGGNQPPVYSTSAQLQVNGQQPALRGNQAAIDEQTGELVIGPMSVGGNNNGNALTVTRRLLLDTELAAVRYVDVIENAGPAEQEVSVSIQSSLHYPIMSGTTITDERRRPRGRDDQPLAWIGHTQHAPRAAVELFAGRGAEVLPALRTQNNSNQVSLDFQITIPAGQQVALLHVHATAQDEESGRELIESLGNRELIADLPKEIRDIVINFRGRGVTIAGHELLRGEVFDVIELRGGDVIRGTLVDPSYALTTPHGPIELPADRVLGLVNVGQRHPRQVVATADGQAIGGTLDEPTIGMELSTGQTTRVPLDRVARVGYRLRPDEPEEWTLAQPHVVLRGGDRLIVSLPPEPIEVLTRYGLLRLDPAAVAAVVVLSEEHPVHRIVLTDGSELSGLLTDAQVTLTLSGLPSPQQATMDVARVERIQLAVVADEEPAAEDPLRPVLEMTTGDVLVGTLSGELMLETEFDALALRAAEVRALTPRADGAAGEVQVTLYDESVLSGALRDGELTCALQSGMTLTVPAGMVSSYRQPQPQPPTAVADRVREIVAELNHDDWRQRDLAEQKLIAMGVAVAPVLRQLRDEQPPEARQRIDQILARFDQP